ncbi:MAG TPA: PIG-L family deacetylase [Gemmatimonadaceae bacterium]|nr:PIG-L family deacetylase [Gemmatimonadaceae bacterium]
MTKRAIILCGLVGLQLAVAPRLKSQTIGTSGAATLGELVEGLGTTARVLVIGAHPDDEDTRLIAWLAKGRHVETAYLSLTRGDGGQNLIGDELGPELGMIRTEELLAARRIDGGRQFFTRAYDFGFTKTLSETERLWPKDSILEDMVAIVRAYRPHVIISIWSGTPSDGHGQHQYAGVVAREVFDASADTVRFPPSKLGGLPAWQAMKFYRSRGFRGGPTSYAFNTGEYDPLLGESYAEIASVSRSQHRSQGQGSVPQLGPAMDGVKLEVSKVSDPAGQERTLFDGIDTSWARFKDLSLPDSSRRALDSLVSTERAVRSAERLAEPSAMVAPLAHLLQLVSRAQTAVQCNTLVSAADVRLPPCTPRMGDLALALETEHARTGAALLHASGVVIQATAPRELVATGDSLPVTITVFNEGREPVTLLGTSAWQTARVNGAAGDDKAIEPGESANVTQQLHAAAEPTVSWWLRHPLRGDMFDFGDTGNSVPVQLVEGEDRVVASGATIALRIAGADAVVDVDPIVHRFADRARGEVDRPIATVPAITVLLQHEIEYALANHPFDRTMVVHVASAATAPRQVDVTLALPRGLVADTATRHVTLPPFGDADLYFRLSGTMRAGRDSITAVATSQGERFATGYVPIEYEHIRPLRSYRPSTVRIEAVPATYAKLKVGYVRGVGDNVLPMLQELGLDVTELDPARLPQTSLAGFTTIVLGTRAYESDPALVKNNAALMRFAREGGTLVVQYSQAAIQRLGVLPYPVTFANPADRVTDETAPVRVVDPGSPVLAVPNKIGEQDFANWVQERALYMPRTFDSAYRPVFSMNDPGEAPNDAALLVAPIGKGTYVYTTLSFFRQLPAGNPGAARLFINLLSATPAAAHRPPVPASGAVRP